MNKLFSQIEATGAIKQNGHFVYTSGSHGSVYFNKDAIFAHPKLVNQLSRQIATHFVEQKIKIDAVIGPAIGGVILSQAIAYHLQLLQKIDVVALYADKTSKSSGFIIRRGYDKLIRGRNTLVVEDVINTGGSVRLLLDQARKHQASIVGLACLCNRGNQSSQSLGVPTIFSLIELNLEIYPANQCKLCAMGVPIDTSLGKKL